jgi:hypothetical protein
MARAIGHAHHLAAAVEDRRALLNHIAKNAPDDLTAFVRNGPRRAVRGGARELPGVRIYEERAAA